MEEIEKPSRLKLLLKKKKEHNVSKEKLINTCYLSNSYEENCYRELIESKAQLGRKDLVDGIYQIIRRYHEQDLKGIVKRLDRIFFDGNLLNMGKKLKEATAKV